jgi:hypothetical protein
MVAENGTVPFARVRGFRLPLWAFGRLARGEGESRQGQKAAMADTVGTEGNKFTIDFVPISGVTNPTIGFGTVKHDYRIGTYKITNGQWNKFTASLGVPVTGSDGGYDSNSYYTHTNVPVNNVSWFAAARFALRYTAPCLRWSLCHNKHGAALWHAAESRRVAALFGTAGPPPCQCRREVGRTMNVAAANASLKVHTDRITPTVPAVLFPQPRVVLLRTAVLMREIAVSPIAVCCATSRVAWTSATQATRSKEGSSRALHIPA